MQDLCWSPDTVPSADFVKLYVNAFLPDVIVCIVLEYAEMFHAKCIRAAVTFVPRTLDQQITYHVADGKLLCGSGVFEIWDLRTCLCISSFTSPLPPSQNVIFLKNGIIVFANDVIHVYTLNPLCNFEPFRNFLIPFEQQVMHCVKLDDDHVFIVTAKELKLYKHSNETITTVFSYSNDQYTVSVVEKDVVFYGYKTKRICQFTDKKTFRETTIEIENHFDEYGITKTYIWRCRSHLLGVRLLDDVHHKWITCDFIHSGYVDIFETACGLYLTSKLCTYKLDIVLGRFARIHSSSIRICAELPDGHLICAQTTLCRKQELVVFDGNLKFGQNLGRVCQICKDSCLCGFEVDVSGYDVIVCDTSRKSCFCWR